MGGPGQLWVAGTKMPWRGHHGVALSGNPLLLSCWVSKPAMAIDLGLQRHTQREREELIFLPPLRGLGLNVTTIVRFLLSLHVFGRTRDPRPFLSPEQTLTFAAAGSEQKPS